MHDADYEDKNKQYGALLRQCFVRSAFLLMDEEVLGDLNYHLHNFTEEDAYLKDYSSDNIGQQKVFDCFKKINEDKKRLEGGTQFGTV